MLRGVVYRLIESLASMGHSSIWKLICAISVCNTLTVGVDQSSTPSISGPGSATACRGKLVQLVNHMSNLTKFYCSASFACQYSCSFFIEKCMPESRNFCQVYLTIKLALILVSFVFLTQLILLGVQCFKENYNFQRGSNIFQ